MQCSPKAVKLICALCFTLTLLIPVSFGSCITGRWKLLHTDKVSDGVPISSLAFTDSNHGWILTPFQLLETADGGKTWTERMSSEDTEQMTTERKVFYSLGFINPATGWIVGTQNKDGAYTPLILRTTDSGETWQESSVNIKPQPNARLAPRLQSVSFCGPSVGWTVGSDLILHTTDGGQTWEIQRSSNKDEVFFAVMCVSPEHVWVVGQGGIILQTKNGGQSWGRQDSGTTDNLMRVRFFGDIGWIVGGAAGKGTLLQTRDGGAKWKRMPLEISEALFDIYLSGSQGWITGSQGTILHTKDSGQTWQQQKSPTNNDLISLFFISPQQGWAGGNKRTLLHLSD